MLWPVSRVLWHMAPPLSPTPHGTPQNDQPRVLTSQHMIPLKRFIFVYLRSGLSFVLSPATTAARVTAKGLAPVSLMFLGPGSQFRQWECYKITRAALIIVMVNTVILSCLSDNIHHCMFHNHVSNCFNVTNSLENQTPWCLVWRIIHWMFKS